MSQELFGVASTRRNIRDGGLEAVPPPSIYLTLGGRERVSEIVCFDESNVTHE